MKTKIFVLLVFLVLFSFFNLSCQKDTGVESAGNNAKGNISSENINSRTDCDDPNFSFEVIMDLYKHSAPNTVIYTFRYPDDGLPSHEYSIANPVKISYTLDGSISEKYDLKLTFNWNRCLPVCNTSWYKSNSSFIALFGIYEDIEGVGPGDCVFGSCLTKPYGAPEEGFLNNEVTGSATLRYNKLENNSVQLTPGTKYWFCAWWTWATEPVSFKK